MNFGILSDFFSTKINYEKVLEIHNLSPKRICLQTCHKNALGPTNFVGDVKWALFIPFDKSIKRIFEKETGLRIYQLKSGKFWCPMESEKEYQKAVAFKSKYDEIVFLRDNLDISISLSEHFADGENKTIIGELERKAKYENCDESINNLIERVHAFISDTPFYKEINYICAVPPSDPAKINLPTNITNGLLEEGDYEDLSSLISWKAVKEPLKEKTFDDKWNTLVTAGMNVNQEIKGKSIILVDDLYQSGTTIQYVAMKLKEAGAKKIYGLTITKSRRDTDNI